MMQFYLRTILLLGLADNFQMTESSVKRLEALYNSSNSVAINNASASTAANDEVITKLTDEITLESVSEVNTPTDEDITESIDHFIIASTAMIVTTPTIGVTKTSSTTITRTSSSTVTTTPSSDLMTVPLDVTTASSEETDSSSTRDRDMTASAVTIGTDEGLPGMKRSSDYYRLEDRLFAGYRANMRPVLSHHTTTNLSLVLEVTAVHEVNAVYQTLRQSMWLTITWTDQFLTWDPDEFNGLRKIEVPISKVWYPKVAIVNSISSVAMLSDTSVPALLSSEGRVIWVQPSMQETLCQLDITFYPFDTQTCSVIVDQWTSSEAEVNVTSLAITKDEIINQNSEWQLTGLSFWRDANLYNGLPYISCTFTLHLKRRRLFHTLTLIVPNVLLALLTPLVFLLPQDSGEKMSFCMSLLLTFAVNLSVLVSSMPRSSLHVSVLMVYLTCLSVVTALAVATSVYLLSLYHHTDRLVGSKARAVILFLRLVGSKARAVILFLSALCMLHGRQQWAARLEGKGTDKPTEVNDDPSDILDLAYEKVKVKSADETHLDYKEMTWRDAAAILDSVCLRVFVFLMAGMASVFVLAFNL